MQSLESVSTRMPLTVLVVVLFPGVQGFPPSNVAGLSHLLVLVSFCPPLVHSVQLLHPDQLPSANEGFDEITRFKI